MSRPLPQLPGVEHRWVDAGGVRLHVAEAGEGDPVVCVHGWPQNWWEWRGLIPVLAEGYRVICPDLRGLGWSEAPRMGYEKEQFARDIAALLDTLGLKDVRLIGHDWGGVAGFILCVRRPDLVRQYLALNTGHLWPRMDGQHIPDLRRFWYQWLIATPFVGQAFVRQLARVPASESYRVTGSSRAWNEEDTRIFLGQFAERARTWATVQTYRTFVTHELADWVRGAYRDTRLTVPTLWLHGAEDPVIRPFMTEGTEDHADDLTVELVEDAAHFIADERPELVVERALTFFASAPTAGSSASSSSQAS